MLRIGGLIELKAVGLAFSTEQAYQYKNNRQFEAQKQVKITDSKD